MSFEEWYKYFVSEQLHFYTTEERYLSILEAMYNVAYNTGYDDGYSVRHDASSRGEG